MDSNHPHGLEHLTPISPEGEVASADYLPSGVSGTNGPGLSRSFGLIDLFLLLPVVWLGVTSIPKVIHRSPLATIDTPSPTNGNLPWADPKILVPIAFVGVLIFLLRRLNRPPGVSHPGQKSTSNSIRTQIFPSRGSVSERVRQLALQPDRYVEAIKELRTETGLDLTDAKAVIDSIRSRHNLRRMGTRRAG